MLLLCIGAVAQSGKDTTPFLLQHFDNSNGLPQNSVNAIGKDPHGYIWLATENGLMRFDGHRFKLRAAEHPPLRNNRFYFIFRRAGQLQAMNYDNEVVNIRDGSVYVDTLSYNEPLDYIKWRHPLNDQDTGTSYHIRLPSLVQMWSTLLKSLRLHANDSRVYLFSNDSLTISRNGRTEHQYPFRNNGSWNFFLLQDQLFFLQKDGRIVHLGPQPCVSALRGDIQQDPGLHSHPEKIKIFWTSLHPYHALLYLDKSFYIATVDGDGLVTRKIFSGFDVDATRINCAYYDEGSGMLYLGSSTQGLFILLHRQFTVRNAPQNANSHYSILPFGTGKILSANGYLFDLIQNKVVHFQKSSVVLLDFYNMVPDSTGGIFGKAQGLLRHFAMNPFRIKEQWGFPGRVTMIHYGKQNQLWIGLNNQQGIWKLDVSHPGGLPVSQIDIRKDATCFAENGDTLFIGANGGFYIYNTHTRRLDSIAGLNGKYIRSVKVSAANELWITTYDDGFFLWKGGRLTAFPLDNDKYIANAHCIFEDKKGFFWITTNKGLFQVQRQDLLDYAKDTTFPPYYHYYDIKDGFATNEFNGGCQPCAAEMDNGYAVLPSLNGLVFYDPGSIHPLLPSAPVLLDRMLLGKKELTSTEIVQLPESFNSFQLEFSSPYMGNRKNLQLNYSLVRAGERDTVWLPLSEDGRITFSTLPSGNYQLIVRKLNGFGFRNYSDKTLLLHVNAPWYESKYFYVLLLLLGIGGTILITRLRTMYVKRKNEMLELLVAAKTHELRERQQLQEKIIQSVNHNILTPLRYQQLLSQRIYDYVKNETGSFSDMARVMNDHTRYLYHMVSNLLKYLKSQMADRPEATGEFAPAKTAEAVMQIFTEIAKEKNTVITNLIPENLQLYGNETLISVMLYNLTDNAVKVTRNGEIHLAARVTSAGTMLVISDTGPGLQASVKEWFNGNKLHDIPGIGDGIGLIIVKELAQMMHLHVFVISEPGSGSEFTIFFPGGKELS